MGNLSSVLLAVQVLSSLAIIGLVLLQQGKGADMGSAFGSGSAGSVFGAAGAANFLSRLTKWAAIVFFVTTGGLAWVAHHPSKQATEGVMQGYESSVPGGAANDTVVPALTPAVPSLEVPSLENTPAANEVPSAGQVPAPEANSSIGAATEPGDSASTETPESGTQQ